MDGWTTRMLYQRDPWTRGMARPVGWLDHKDAVPEGSLEQMDGWIRGMAGAEGWLDQGWTRGMAGTDGRLEKRYGWGTEGWLEQRADWNRGIAVSEEWLELIMAGDQRDDWNRLMAGTEECWICEMAVPEDGWTRGIAGPGLDKRDGRNLGMAGPEGWLEQSNGLEKRNGWISEMTGSE
jgi:hypothetical protein